MTASTETFFNTPRSITAQFSTSATDSYNGPGSGYAGGLLQANSGGLGFRVFEIHIASYFDGGGHPFGTSPEPQPFYGTFYFGTWSTNTFVPPMERVCFGPGTMNKGKTVVKFDGSDPDRTANFIVPVVGGVGWYLNAFGIFSPTNTDNPLVTVIGADAL